MTWNAAGLASAVEALIVHSRLDMPVAELQFLCGGPGRLDSPGRIS